MLQQVVKDEIYVLINNKKSIQSWEKSLKKNCIFDLVLVIDIDGNFVVVKNLSSGELMHFSMEDFLAKIIEKNDIVEKINSFGNKEWQKFSKNDEVFVRGDIGDGAFFVKMEYIGFDKLSGHVILKRELGAIDDFVYIDKYKPEDLFTRKQILKEIENRIDKNTKMIISIDERLQTMRNIKKVFQENNYKDVPRFNIFDRIKNLETEKKSFGIPFDQIVCINKGIKRLTKQIYRFKKRYPDIDMELIYKTPTKYERDRFLIQQENSRLMAFKNDLLSLQ